MKEQNIVKLVFSIIIIVGIGYFVYIIIRSSFGKNAKGIEGLIEENPGKTMATLIFITTGMSLFALVLLATQNGKDILLSFMRYGVIVFIEAYLSIFFSIYIGKVVSDSKISNWEIVVALVYWLLAFCATMAVSVFYLEAEGVVKFVVTNNLFPKKVVKNNAPVEISSLVMIYSTPLLNLLSAWWQIKNMRELAGRSTSSKPSPSSSTTSTTSATPASTTPSSSSSPSSSSPSSSSGSGSSGSSSGGSGSSGSSSRGSARRTGSSGNP